ncbi:MAG TPA: MgtC/SapB family protein [Candidatus Paceibacterota bacterium]
MDILLIDSELTLALQLIVAVLLGIVLGAERAIAGKTAGMRTYALVSMGSCLFVIISTVVTKSLLGLTGVDPLRVVAGIVTGVGFIGAGLIIFKETSVRGLTTAAGLWVAAGVGVAVGYKLYIIALFSVTLTVFIFTILWFIENKIKFFSYNDNGKDTTEIVSEENETVNKLS